MGTRVIDCADGREEIIAEIQLEHEVDLVDEDRNLAIDLTQYHVMEEIDEALRRAEGVLAAPPSLNVGR